MFARLIALFFKNYISFIIKKDFKAFHFNKPKIDENKAILLISNHFSWWDGFLLYHLNRKYLKKNFHVMVTEENYRDVFFLKYLGAFPVKKNSRNMLEALEYAGKLLNDKNNLVLIFPQGKLYSNHIDEVVFEKGLINLINSSNRNFQYLFSAMFVDYFNKRHPAIWCYLDTWAAAEFTSLQLIKSAYNKHFENSRQQHNRITI